MRTKVVKVIVIFEDGTNRGWELTHGSVMTSKTRVKGRILENEDALTDVYQVSVNGEVKVASNDAVAPSDPPESLPENDEVANGIDD